MMEFIEALFPPERDPMFRVIELRCLDPLGKKSTKQHWFSVQANVEAYALERSPDYDVYFGVLPRIEERGDSTAIDDYTHVLWGDYDPKVLTKPGLFGAITTLSPRPQIVIDSGSGYHVYWLLDRSYPFAEAQTVMKDIARVTGGDMVHDKARILRLPGTLNHKTDPPKPVRLLRLDTLAPRHRLSDFYAYDGISLAYGTDLAFEELYGPQKKVIRIGSVYPNTPDWLLNLIATDPGHGLRSEHVFHVVACLVERGHTDEEIEEIMQANPRGVGAKYAEKGSAAHRWLHYPIIEARRRNRGE